MNFIKSGFEKYAVAIIFSAVFIFIATGSVYAESLFLKDGSISEGSVVTETDRTVKFKFADGKVKEIPRIDILRVLHHTDYTQKKYIYKTDTSLVEAFIVDEDKLTYTYRIDLNSPNEFNVLKTEIETISKKKLEFASDKKEKVMTREENIVTRASRWRLGVTFEGPFDMTSDYIHSRNSSLIRGINLDLFPYRMRDVRGNGLDLLIRGSINNSDTHEEKDMTKVGYTLKPGSTFEYGDIFQIAGGCGLRYISGWYIGGILYQGYLLGYYQFSSITYHYGYKISGKEGDEKHISTSNGFAGGAGIEVAFLSYVGIFVEYTNGYSRAFPAGKNAEGGYFRLGLTLRTSYL